MLSQRFLFSHGFLKSKLLKSQKNYFRVSKKNDLLVRWILRNLRIRLSLERSLAWKNVEVVTPFSSIWKSYVDPKSSSPGKSFACEFDKKLQAATTTKTIANPNLNMLVATFFSFFLLLELEILLVCVNGSTIVQHLSLQNFDHTDTRCDGLLGLCISFSFNCFKSKTLAADHVSTPAIF